MKPRFCPKCGVTEDKAVFVKGFCKKCFLEKENLIQAPISVGIPFCMDCEKIYFKGHMVFGTEKTFLKLLSKQMDTKILDKPSFSIEMHEGDNPLKLRAKVVASGLVDGKELSFEQDFLISLEKKQCSTCKKISAGYFQSRIELRWDVKEQDVKNTLKILKKHAAALKKEGVEDTFISGVAEVKDGVDILLGSYHLAERSIKEIAKKLDSRCRVSKKLLGIDRETSKQRYRSYYKFVIRPAEEKENESGFDTAVEETDEPADEEE
ncbi:MAG: hypothetical protein J7K00_00435 [Candidatus Diapherotrites archaeon]|nr:hypothetical protein [Candidatus Diapherotrites archaeon]